MMWRRELKAELARLVMGVDLQVDGLSLVPEYYIDQARKP
jgi:hypothetical protein